MSGCFLFRYLNDKQKALVLAFAELEDDVSGTVNGVDKSTGKKIRKNLSSNSRMDFLAARTSKVKNYLLVLTVGNNV